jgi:aryl-alcohol dehydrogenase-like predicted oxidoreductase
MFRRRRVEYELMNVCDCLGIGLTTWSPLASGILTGKYNEGIPKDSRAAKEGMAWIKDEITSEKIMQVRALTGLAGDLGLTMAQLAIAWILRRKEVSSVITGATRVNQLEENIAAGDAVDKLSDNILELIESILDNHPDEE